MLVPPVSAKVFIPGIIQESSYSGLHFPHFMSTHTWIRTWHSQQQQQGRDATKPNLWLPTYDLTSHTSWAIGELPISTLRIEVKETKVAP